MTAKSSKSLYGQMAGIFVPHPNFIEIETEIKDVLGLHGTDDEVPCLHISGPAGIGKTTLLKRLAQKFPVEPNGRTVSKPPHPDMVADHVPLLRCEMPSQPTPKSMAMQMLKGLNDEKWNKGDRFGLEQRLDIYLEACGTAGILIDEAQRAVDRSGTVVAEHLMEWFKERHNATGVTIIFLGLGRLRHLFEQDKQIERRWDAELRMRPYRWVVQDGGGLKEDTEDQNRFIGVLVAFSKMSPIPFAIDVTDDDTAKRCFYASQGVIGSVKKLLKTAMRIAMRDDRTVVDLALLEAAFDKAFRKEIHGMINPFGSAWDGRLPPPLEDDTVLLRPKKPSNRQMRRGVIDSLTKGR